LRRVNGAFRTLWLSSATSSALTGSSEAAVRVHTALSILNAARQKPQETAPPSSQGYQRLSLFSAIDSNKDGLIDAEELRNALKVGIVRDGRPVLPEQPQEVRQDVGGAGTSWNGDAGGTFQAQEPRISAGIIVPMKRANETSWTSFQSTRASESMVSGTDTVAADTSCSSQRHSPWGIVSSEPAYGGSTEPPYRASTTGRLSVISSEPIYRASTAGLPTPQSPPMARGPPMAQLPSDATGAQMPPQPADFPEGDPRSTNPRRSSVFFAFGDNDSDDETDPAQSRRLTEDSGFPSRRNTVDSGFQSRRNTAPDVRPRMSTASCPTDDFGERQRRSDNSFVGKQRCDTTSSCAARAGRHMSLPVNYTNLSHKFTVDDVSRRRTLAAQALGVRKTAAGHEVSGAFYKGARQVHPDKGGQKEDFQVLREAYARLRSTLN